MPLNRQTPSTFEVVELISNKLDPKTLAIASCVSKSWFSSMSADHLWAPLCTSVFPSISNLHPAVPYHRIYALGHSSAQRRLQPLPKPRLSLDNLLLAITPPHANTILRSFNELDKDPNGVFRFDFDVKDDDFSGFLMKGEIDDYLKLTCNIFLKGFEGVFTVLDGKGKGGSELWYTEELPSPCCCFSGGGSGLVAEISLGACGNQRRGRVRVSFGVMNVGSWRYASVDDTLRYLQHFLLPSCYVF